MQDVDFSPSRNFQGGCDTWIMCRWSAKYDRNAGLFPTGVNFYRPRSQACV